MLDNLYFTNAAGGRASPKLLSQPGIGTAGGVYLAKLGDFMFSLDTAAFQQLARDTSYRWASLPRIGREPAMQFTGIGEDKIDLSGSIYPHFRGGLAQVGQMRAAAGDGKPLALIYGFDRVGQYCGRWCITHVHEGRTVFLRDGTPKKIDFTLSLAYYGEDSDGGADAVLPYNFADEYAGDTAVKKPRLLGSRGDGLTASAAAVRAIPKINASSPLASVQKVAKALSGTANGASVIAVVAGLVIGRTLGNLTSGALSLVPADARKAAASLVDVAGQVGTSQRDVDGSLATLSGSPSGVKSTASDYERQMRAVSRASVQHGATTRGAASKLASTPHGGAPSDVDRMLAAAALANISREADNLTFATSEASRQTTDLMDAIDV